jgi:hypothetical protein
MKLALKATCAAIVMSAGLVATPAWACGYSGKLAASWQDQGDRGALFHQAADVADPIVGMWQFRMSAGGTTADFGFQQWHSDGTEVMNSGGRAPATENFCLGVWRQVGVGHYHLNHFALSYDTSGTLNAKINLKEDVMLDATGSTFRGTFTIDVYDPNTAALVGHQAGNVAAKRVPSY